MPKGLKIGARRAETGVEFWEEDNERWGVVNTVSFPLGLGDGDTTQRFTLLSAVSTQDGPYQHY